MFVVSGATEVRSYLRERSCCGCTLLGLNQNEIGTRGRRIHALARLVAPEEDRLGPLRWGSRGKIP